MNIQMHRKRREQGTMLLVTALIAVVAGSTLAYFLTAVPPERHPLVVALYFFSKWPERPDGSRLESVAELMDEHEERLGPMPENEPDPDGASR